MNPKSTSFQFKTKSSASPRRHKRIKYTLGGYEKRIASNDIHLTEEKPFHVVYNSPATTINKLKKISVIISEEPLLLSSTDELSIVIEKSQYILDLKDNWDDEGAKSYLLSTWEKATNFLLEYSKWYLKNIKRSFPVPEIYHAPEGSIDILWETATVYFLINIPENGKGAYFGQDYISDEVEGHFNVDKPSFALLPTLQQF